jgi:very-short-patch-repair endonuclease
MKLEEYNWKEIQEYHNNGYGWREISKKFNISQSALSKANKNGLFKSRNVSEAQILSHKQSPRTHTFESKKKISLARLKFLENNPDAMPFRLYHSSKESYPEKYFAELFEKENIKVERYLPVSYYELDFCIPDKKINIEIDGNQHYTLEKIIESDKKRNEYLISHGWETIRIKWSDYQKMDFERKTKYIKELKDYINKLSIERPSIPFIENGKKLCECGAKIWETSNKCLKCANLASRKLNISVEQLIKDVEEIGYSATGRKYGVSNNCIKKRIKKAY